MRRALVFVLLLFCFSYFLSAPLLAADGDLVPNLDLGSGSLDSVQLLMVITALALAPAVLIMMTSFTRIIIVLSFVRNALGLQQTPPNQVLIGLALFLSLFVMSPVIDEINTKAYVPYTQGAISQSEALNGRFPPPHLHVAADEYGGLAPVYEFGGGGNAGRCFRAADAGCNPGLYHQ